MSSHKQNKTPESLTGIIKSSLKSLEIELNMNSLPYTQKLTTKAVTLSGLSSETPQYFAGEINRIIQEWKNTNAEMYGIVEQLSKYNEDNYAHSILAARALERNDYDLAFRRFFEVCEKARDMYKTIISTDNENIIAGDPVKGLERTANELLRMYEEMSPWLRNGWETSVYEFTTNTAEWIRENTGRKSVALRDSYYNLAKHLKRDK